MKKVVALVLSLLMVLMVSAPVYALAESERLPLASDYGYINATDVNLRTGPGTSYTSIAKLAKYTELEISDTLSTPSWCYVIVRSGTHNGKSGYVSAQYVTIYDA